MTRGLNLNEIKVLAFRVPELNEHRREQGIEQDNFKNKEKLTLL